MLPVEILQICADYLHCILVPVDDGYELRLKPCKYFEVIFDLDGNPLVVPCQTMQDPIYVYRESAIYVRKQLNNGRETRAKAPRIETSCERKHNKDVSEQYFTFASDFRNTIKTL